MRKLEPAEPSKRWDQLAERICGADEAAEITGLGLSSVKERCRSGAIRAKRIGKGTWVIDRKSLAPHIRKED